MTGVGVRRRWSLAVVALIVVATSVFAPFMHGHAEAHAVLVSSSPENGAQEQRPPFRVVLNFSEPVEPRLTDIRVLDQDGEQVDSGDVEVNPDDRRTASVGVPTLPPGLYTVEFNNVSSVDGHPWNGIYQFIVLNPDGTVPEGAEFDPDAVSASGTGLLPPAVDSALKWIGLVALAAVAGAAFFLFAVLRPAAGFLDDEQYQAAADAGERWVVNLAHVLLPLSFIASAALLLISVNRFETGTSFWEYVTEVRTGQYRGLQLALLVVALVGADVLFLAKSARWRNVGLTIAIAASLGALLTYSLVSHSAVGEGRYWSTASDYLHLVASAVWLGALIMLVPVLMWVRKRFDETTRFLYLANTFDRFSIVAGVSVVIIIATGAFNGMAAVPTSDAMTETTYGRVLLAKIALILPLLAIAGVNALVLKPRLVSVIDGLYQRGGTEDRNRRAAWERSLAWLQSWLPRTIAVEIVLVVAVFASVGVLTQTSTAEGEIAQQRAAEQAGNVFRDVRTDGDLTLELKIQPNTVGLNRYDVQITESGGPIEDVTQARLRFFYQDPAATGTDDQGFAELLLRQSADGGYTGQGAYFTQPGSWRVEVGIQQEEGDDISRTFIVGVAPPEVDTTSDDPWSLPFTVFTWNEVVGAALAIIGVMILLYRQSFSWMRASGYRVAVTGATAFLLAGAVLVLGVDQHSTVANPQAGNPVEPTNESIEAGRMLFQQNCIVCHGPEGRGDGPQAENLDPRPVDIRQHLPLHTDPQFYAFIANGVPGTAMPAWSGQLSEEDIWNLVNFMRREFRDAPSE